MSTGVRVSMTQSSAPHQVANALRDLLLAGEIPPGVKLREVALAKEIGVSRHTLRSGFRILEAEGLLQHSINRGVIVPDLSEDRIADVFRARKALEFAGVHSIDRGNAERAVDQMESAVERMKTSRDDAELAVADLDFHSAVVAAVGSRLVDELYRNVQAQLRLTRAWAIRTRGDRDQMAKTHGVVVEHLRTGRIQEAAEALMSINDVGADRLQSAMRESTSQDESRPAAWPPNHSDDEREG